MVGVVAAKDLPAEPSEEELRLGLRSGIILCNVLNKVQPGAVPKVNLISPIMCICVCMCRYIHIYIFTLLNLFSGGGKSM